MQGKNDTSPRFQNQDTQGYKNDRPTSKLTYTNHNKSRKSRKSMLCHSYPYPLIISTLYSRIRSLASISNVAGICCTHRIRRTGTEIKPWLRGYIECSGCSWSRWFSVCSRFFNEVFAEGNCFGKDFDVGFVFYDFAEKVLTFPFPVLQGSSTVWMVRGKLQLRRVVFGGYRSHHQWSDVVVLGEFGFHLVYEGFQCL